MFFWKRKIFLGFGCFLRIKDEALRLCNLGKDFRKESRSRKEHSLLDTHTENCLLEKKRKIKQVKIRIELVS